MDLLKKKDIYRAGFSIVKSKYDYIFNFSVFVLFTSFFLKSSFPLFLNFIFYFSLTLSSFLFVYRIKKNYPGINYKFLSYHWIYLALLILYIIGYLRTPNIYLFKEIFKGFVSFIIIVFVISAIKNKDDIKIALNFFTIVTILSLSLIAFVCIILNLFFPNLKSLIGLTRPFSMANDYNVYALFLTMSIVLIIQQMQYTISKTKSTILNFAVLLLILNTIFTTSRRGIFFILLLIIFFLILMLINIFSKYKRGFNLLKNARLFLILGFIGAILIVISLFNFSPELKHQFIFKKDSDGKIKEQLTYPIARYLHVDYKSFYNGIWYNKFPSSIAFLHSSKLQELSDKLLLSFEDYAFQENCNCLNIQQWQSGIVYCDYVNEFPIYGVIANGFNDGMAVNINAPRFCQIFIKIKIKVIEYGKDLRVMTLTDGKYISNTIANYRTSDSIININMKVVYNATDVPRVFLIGGSTTNPSKFALLNISASMDENIDYFNNELDFTKFKYESLFTQNNLLNRNYIGERNAGSKSQLQKEEKLVEIDDNRLDFLKYAYFIWKNEYNIKDKIFGKGFSYTNQFGLKFHNNPNRIEYPHNPIISTFLYSGIIGGVLYIFFIIYSIVLYFKYYKYLQNLFIIYLLCLFFFMFSGNSHFSAPFFTILSIVPFTIKYIFKIKFLQNNIDKSL